MAKIWKEQRRNAGSRNLETVDTFFVHVAFFPFQFDGVDPLRECVQFFEQKTHPSSRVSAKRLEANLGPEWRELRGWDVERWFERLPMYLLEEPKRPKVLKALSKALSQIEAGDL